MTFFSFLVKILGISLRCDFLGGLLGGAMGAAGSIAGATISANAQKEANAQNIAFQKEQNKLNYQHAKEFAQNSMKWKAKDLYDSGINPIYGLGAGGYSAPVGQAPHAEPVDMGSGIGQAARFFGKEIAELSKAQAAKIASEANLNNAKAKELNDRVLLEPSGTIRTQETNPVQRDVFFQDGKGVNWRAPSPTAAESFEQLPWYQKLAIWMDDLQGVDKDYVKNLQKSVKHDPLKQRVDVDWFGNYKVVDKRAPHYFSKSKKLNDLLDYTNGLGSKFRYNINKLLN